MVYMHYIASRRLEPGTIYPHLVWMVISPDRNTADTLFRILQDNKGKRLKIPSVNVGSTNLTPVTIDRLSPKLWTLQIKESPENVASLAMGPDTFHGVDSVFDNVAGKIFLYSMGNHPDLGAKLLPAACDVDHDYISGYSFFIRRCGYPNTYWYCCGNLICLSTTKRSRFIIRIVDRDNEDGNTASKTPMVNQDMVLIQWVEPDGCREVGLDDNEWLTVKAKNSKTFTFSDFQGRFYLGNEGTLDHSDLARLGTTLDVVCWSTLRVPQDSFELCYGIPPYDGD